jgi:hypothetical protein
MTVPWVTSQEAGSLQGTMLLHGLRRRQLALENPIETDSGHREAASYHSGQQPILQ